MSSEEYDMELKKQIEEKKKQQMQEKVQNQQEILNHYKNYQLGADLTSGEDPLYMKDLDALVKNRQREIERMGGVVPMSGFSQLQRNEVFSGDMNAFTKQQNQNDFFSNDKKHFDLFSDNFIQGFQQQAKNNENLNIINSIFGNANPVSVNVNPTSAESERERRLKLREMERLKRQEGFSGGGYGKIEEAPQQPPSQFTSQTQQNIFGDQDKPQSAVSKRDLVWQQKLQQRMNSQEGKRQPLHQPPSLPIQQNVSQMLPLYQAQGLPPQIQSIEQCHGAMMSPDQAVRASRIINNLSDARKLDQSINLDKEGADQQKGFLQIGGDDDLIKKRRDQDKRLRQLEYQEFLAKQQKQGQKPPLIEQSVPFQNVSTTVPSSSQSHQRPSYKSESNSNTQQNNNVLQNGGLQQLGMHQAQKQEDKARLQKEYKQMLDLQNQQKQQLQSAGAPRDRKQELSDQVFAEILGSNQKVYPQVQQESYIQPYVQRENSAPVQQRQEQQQQQVPQGLFAKLQGNEEDKKREAIEKKKEYAMQLQQQMMLKQQQQQQVRRRGTSQVAHQQPQMAMEPQLGVPIQKQVFDYQQPVQFMPSHVLPENMHSFQPFGQDPYQQNQQMFVPNQYIPDQFHHYQQQPSLQLNNIPYPQQQLNQPVTPTNTQQQQEQSSKEAARMKQDEYRRDLEMQIKLKEDQKKQKLIQEQQIEMKYERDFQQAQNFNQQAQPIISPAFNPENPAFQNPYQPPPSAPVSTNNFVRQRTDVSQVKDPHEEQEKMLRQMQYQAELQKQMEEKKRQKEEEKRKKKLEDEEHERKLQKELESINMKDHQELVKEGKRDPNAPYQPPKVKQVRRDQFEPSQDNPNAAVNHKQQSNQVNDQRRNDLFGNNQKDEMFKGFEPMNKVVDLPIHSRREDLFSNNRVIDPQPIMEINPTYEQQYMPTQQSSNYYQNNPSSYQNQQNFQQEPMQMQQRMMEEQTKMIQMYQQALEQILQFRNQYFEQAMQMRENIIKEREQLLEYEKAKQQQSQEIQQLQAVYNQLGNILNTTQTNNPMSSGQTPQITPILNPQVQSNLNNLIISQKQQIMRMSQSEGFNFREQMQNLYPQQRSEHEERPNILEQSLSSETKFVHIPQNKLSQIAGPQLFQTWKQDQIIQKNPTLQVQQSINQSLAGSSHFLTNQLSTQKSPPKLSQTKPNIMGLQSRPQTSQPPETIQELPKEEDEQVNQSRTTTLNAKSLPNKDEENDFNSRESFSKNSRDLIQRQDSSQTMHNNMITKTNPLGNTSTIQENMLQIDRILRNDRPIDQAQQQQRVFSPANKTQDKFQNATGSSFYNQTIHHQKQQEQTQMEELQKQLMRIFGNTQGVTIENQDIVTQMMQKPATPLAQQARLGSEEQQKAFINPLQIASINEKVGGISLEEKDILAQSNINIAQSVSGTQGMTEIIQKANQKFSSNGFYTQMQYENNQIEDESKDDEQYKPYQAINYQQPPDDEEEGTLKQDHDVWNDPDLIPPPVVVTGDEEDYFFEPQVNQSALNQYPQSDLNDGTLQNLQMFSPPSVENNNPGNNFNIGSYEQDDAYDGSSQQTLKSNREFNKSTTKKEKEMLEVAKLIQQAANTANNIFEQSENFRSKMRHKDQEAKLNVNRQNSKKSIKIADPFRNAEQKMQNSTLQQKQTQQESGINLGIVEKTEESKDNDILSNLDKMIMNLQAQQQKYQDVSHQYEQNYQDETDGAKDTRPFSGIPRPTSKMDKSGRKIRPISAVEDNGYDQQQPQRLGKYAQMALQQNHQEQVQQHQRSQRSVGRFAQMALQEGTDHNIIDEIASKYSDADEQARAMKEQYMNLQNQYQQQCILRPVSGKSNSNRYTQMKPQSQQSQRQASNPRQPQLFFDEESDEYSAQNILNSQNNEVQDTSRFNLGYDQQNDQDEECD